MKIATIIGAERGLLARGSLRHPARTHLPAGFCALSECLEKSRFGLGAGCQETRRPGLATANGSWGKGIEGDCL